MYRLRIDLHEPLVLEFLTISTDKGGKARHMYVSAGGQL
jgi:hypothetical protein